MPRKKVKGKRTDERVPVTEVGPSTSLNTLEEEEDGYTSLETILAHPELVNLSIKPSFVKDEKEPRKYHLLNTLSRDGGLAVVLQPEDPENKPAMLCFSAFATQIQQIPEYLWKVIRCKGIAALKGEDKFHVDVMLMHKADGKVFFTSDPRHYQKDGSTDPDGTRYEFKSISPPLDPDMVMIDKLTEAMFANTLMQFVTSASSKLKIDKLTMSDALNEERKRTNTGQAPDEAQTDIRTTNRNKTLLRIDAIKEANNVMISRMQEMEKMIKRDFPELYKPKDQDVVMK